MRVSSGVRARHFLSPLLAVAGGCVAMLTYQAGLWEIGATSFLVVIAGSLAQRNRTQLLGFASIGLAAALAWVTVVQELRSACGSSSARPLVCAAAAGPSAASYVAAALVLASAGALLVALSARSRPPAG